MLLSMTGHGEAHQQQSGLAVFVEVRTINNKYFKLTVRAGEGYASLEPQIEAVVRQHVRRGTVQVVLRVDRDPSPDDFKLNETVLAGYRQQLIAIQNHLQLQLPVPLEALLNLPGVVDQRWSRQHDMEAEWAAIEPPLVAALKNLGQMRLEEGEAMAADLKSNCQLIGRELASIADRAPLVVESYRTRLIERLNKLMAEFQIQVQAADVVREVGMFAERGDISEEIVRLRSHLDQFDSYAMSDDSNGRKLEFLTQEMFRETNTIGSKANDAEIARHVIEIKTAIERIREMIQNVE